MAYVPRIEVPHVLSFVAPNANDPAEQFRNYCGMIVPKRVGRSTDGKWQPLARKRDESVPTLTTLT